MSSPHFARARIERRAPMSSYVQEDALADLLLVDGNPLENIMLVADAAKNFLAIMQDGKIYKNSL